MKNILAWTKDELTGAIDIEGHDTVKFGQSLIIYSIYSRKPIYSIWNYKRIEIRKTSDGRYIQMFYRIKGKPIRESLYARIVKFIFIKLLGWKNYHNYQSPITIWNDSNSK